MATSRGSHAKVKLGKEKKTGEMVAIKVMEKNSQKFEYDTLCREIKVPLSPPGHIRTSVSKAHRLLSLNSRLESSNTEEAEAPAWRTRVAAPAGPRGSENFQTYPKTSKLPNLISQLE